MTGYTREEYLRLDLHDLIADDDADAPALREQMIRCRWT